MAREAMWEGYLLGFANGGNTVAGALVGTEHEGVTRTLRHLDLFAGFGATQQ